MGLDGGGNHWYYLSRTMEPLDAFRGVLRRLEPARQGGVSISALAVGALLALPLCACRKPPKPPESSLRTVMRSLHATPPCDAAIPAEWPASWPVPTGGKDGREYRVFFYPLFRGPGGQPEVFAPLGEAVFDGESGAVSSCRRRPDPPAFVAARRWPEGTDGLTIEEFDLLAARLFAATEDAGRQFYAQRIPSQDELRRLKEYGRLFQQLAEPAFARHYRELNLDFWYWLERRDVFPLK
ncbi:MAG: hypothetical protein HY748_12145 [Elusimicrobia bacterium]|nr:hypothetical protein [Elusimicrobiota bacterium]